MPLTLKNFETHINAKIVDRGEDYFLDGFVRNFERGDDEIYTAIVSGTSDYRVSIRLDKAKVVEHNCECPYDLGPVCKHTVAVLYAIRDSQEERSSKPVKKPEKSKKKKAKTQHEKIAEIYSNLSKEELQEYIESLFATNQLKRRDFIMSYTHLLSEKRGLTFYKKEVKAVLRSVAGRKKFIGWNKTREAWQRLQPFLVQADRAIEKSNYLEAVYINYGLLIQLTDAITYYLDDSSGEIGYLIDQICNNLDQLADTKLKEETRKEFLDLCLKIYKSKVLDGWDWHYRLMEVAIKLATNKTEADKLNRLLDKKQEDDYSADTLKVLKLKLLRKFGDAEDYQREVMKNRNITEVRQSLIQSAIEAKNYEEAKELAKEGQEYHKGNSHYEKEWLEWQLKIVQLQKDRSEIIRVAKLLYMSHRLSDLDLLSIMKQAIPKTKWEKFRTELIADLKAKGLSQKMMSIYVKEDMPKEILLALQESNPNLYTIDNYAAQLQEKYLKQLIALYAKGIYNFMESNVGRKYYKAAVRYLRKIKKLGDEKLSQEISDKLRVLYRTRRALLEELDKL